jgi:hypothetical protein
MSRNRKSDRLHKKPPSNPLPEARVGLFCYRVVSLMRAAVFALFITESTFAQVNVLTANYDNQRTNANLQETILNLSNVNTTSFGKIASFPADGQIHAQPLYAAGVQVPGKGTHNIVYVATMHNSVYAIDGDAPQSTVPLWHVNLGPSVPTTSDRTPEIGILSTPVIDLARQAMYLVAETFEEGCPVFRVHALSLVDGHEVMHGPAVIAPIITGSPDAVGVRDDGSLPFDASQHLQRPGLALTNGTVYVAFGSYGDSGNWHGWLISYNASDLQDRVTVLNTSPNGYGASIWQSGRAPAIDSEGNLYVATGNGDYDGVTNFGESVLKISTADIHVLDWYTPETWSELNDNDWDLGSSGVILLPNHLVLAGTKSGRLYLINSASMGHLGPNNSSSVQSISLNRSGIFDIALWNKDDGPIVYVMESWGPLKAFRIVEGQINAAMLSSNAPKISSAYAGIAVSANGNADGTAIVWQTTADYDTRQLSGTLQAFDALNLSNEIWNSDTVSEDTLGRFAKFVAPTVVNGRVYVATCSNALVIYGLLDSAGSR